MITVIDLYRTYVEPVMDEILHLLRSGQQWRHDFRLRTLGVVLLAINLWARQTVEMIKILRDLWWGILMVVLYTLLAFVVGLPPITRFTAYIYMPVALFFGLLAWTIVHTAHVMRRKSYTIRGNEFVGNNNWLSGVNAVVVTALFYWTGAPLLIIIVFGVLQLVPYFLGDKYQEQARYDIPKFANFALALLAVWILAAG